VRLTNKTEHPSLDIVETHGTELAGKKIVLCVAGSVAAYKSIELARLLMRHGADVTCVASQAAVKLIQPDYFKWATGNKVITKLTGDLEHIKLADYRRSDLVVVYPATANTLGKLANGIDDTPVSTMLTVAFGSKIPIVMALAMHQAMYENKAVLRNIKFLENKIDFVTPSMIEGKAKVAEPEDVLEHILQKFGKSPVFTDKHILITAGPTVEHIDPVRVVTNQSTGVTGILLAKELISAGAKVTLIYGPGSEIPPNGSRTIRVTSVTEMFDAVKKELQKKVDVVIMAAAAADYTIKSNKTKIKSTKNSINIRLQKAPKIIDHIKDIQRNVFLVGFKAETNVSKKNLVTSAKKKMRKSNADMIIANDIGSSYQKNPQLNEVLVINKDGKIVSSGRKKKSEIAKFIKKQLEKRLAENFGGH
jgi:phosphopantothenoylcysteine decarboxylase / phosphopantothenate---cysteine ligase